MRLPVPLAETLLAGWLLARAGHRCAAGADDVAPVRPRDRIVFDADGKLSGRAARRSVRREIANTSPCSQPDGKASARSRWSKTATAVSSERHNLAGDAGERRDVRRACHSLAAAPAPAFDQRLADADGRGGPQRANRRRAGNDPVAQRRLRQRARRLRAADREIPGGAAQPRAARRRNRCGAGGRGFRRGRHRASRSFDDAVFLEVASAKIRIGEAAAEGAAIAHQVHGRIGFSQEHVLHRFTLRLLAGATTSAARAIGRSSSASWSHAMAPTHSGRCWRRDDRQHFNSIRIRLPPECTKLARATCAHSSRRKLPPAPSIRIRPGHGDSTIARSAGGSAPKAGSA